MAILGIIGAGRYGSLVRDLAVCTGEWDSYVFFDDQLPDGIDGKNVIGKFSDIQELYKQQKFDSLAMAVGYKHFSVRKSIFRNLNNIIPFAVLVHPSSYVSSSAKLSPGVQVYSMCNIEMEVTLSECVAIFNNTSITHEVSIGAFSFLSVGVSMGGGVKIGESTFVGVGASLVNDITIGSECVICGGTFLTKGIADRKFVIGNPFKYISKPEF